MKGENFIYFFTVSGFFIGIIFSILKDLDVFYFLIATLVITSLFYIVSLASVSLFIKFMETRNNILFDKFSIDEMLDIQIKELEKKEEFIYKNYEFIKEIEKEEIDILRKRKDA